MKVFIKKNWRICFLLYVVIYLPWFFYLEKTITPATANLHIISSSLDDLIPFCEYFVIPYLIWFLYIIFACIFIFFKGTDKEYLKFVISLIIGMSLSLFICMIYPNGLNLRPSAFPRDNIFTQIIAGLYSTDTSTNVFPSIHVFNSLAIHIALTKSKALSAHKRIRFSSLMLCILICASTLFTKQHSVIDLIGGCVLMTFLYIMIYVTDYSKLTFLQKQKKSEEILE